MKRTFILAVMVCAAGAPLAANAQVPLSASQGQRQAILDQEYRLNQPGLSASAAAAAQSSVAALESHINGDQAPPLDVPAYGSCDADRSVIAYLEDELANGSVDAQQAYTDRRNLYDLQVNLRQRGC